MCSIILRTTKLQKLFFYLDTAFVSHYHHSLKSENRSAPQILTCVCVIQQGC